MPQVTVTFSKGLEETLALQAVCDDVFAALAAHDAFGDPSVIKVLTQPVEVFCVGCAPETFIQASLFLMEGRNAAIRKELNQSILDAIHEHAPDVGSITVQDHEMCAATYVKRA